MTPEERKLWRGLREAFPEAHWRKQVPFGVNYTVDFCSHGHKLIIEVDGGQHAKRTSYDDARTAFLSGEGYRVLRFWNNDVRGNLDGVVEAVARAISAELESSGRQTPAAPSQPSPQGGGL